MSKRDFYDVLGVKKDASADDLKKAFRKLAMREGPVVSAPFLKVGRSRGHKLFTGVVRPEQMSGLGRIAFRAGVERAVRPKMVVSRDLARWRLDF